MATDKCGPMDVADLAARVAVIEHGLELRMSATQRALELQAEIYAQRLDDLNHEAERLRRMQETTCRARWPKRASARSRVFATRRSAATRSSP